MTIPHRATALLLTLFATGAGGQAAQITNLGKNFLGGGINNSGQVAGAYFGPFSTHAAIYSGGSFQDLGTLGGIYSIGNSINSSGQVTGVSTDSSGVLRAFVYSNGSMTAIPLPDSQHSEGLSINDAGEIVGNYDLPPVAGLATRTTGFLYSAGQSQALNVLNAYAINNNSVVAGNRFLGIYADSTGTVQTRNGLELMAGSPSSLLGILDSLGGVNVIPAAVNDAGEIAGWSDTGTGVEAFLYAGGTMKALGLLNGYQSAANGMNQAGDVVGRIHNDARVLDDTAFLYSGGVMTDLDTFLPVDSPWHLYNAHGINDSGQIIADAMLKGDYTARYSVLLQLDTASSAAPEPGTWLLVLGGTLAMAFRAAGVRRGR